MHTAQTTCPCGKLELRRRLLVRGLRLDDVEDGVRRAEDPLGALVRREPVVLRAQAGHVARLEEAEDVARELRADVLLRAQARRADDGA